MDVSNTPVSQILNDVKSGQLVLPDFQRDFVWKPDDVKDLLISVFGDFYIGSMLFMDAIKGDSPFAVRLVSGVSELFPAVQPQSIMKILLDGQQRTSALFYAIFAPPLPLSGRKSPFRFFLKMPALIEGDYENAIEYVNTSNRSMLAAAENNPDLTAMTKLQDVGKFSADILSGPYRSRIDKILSAVNGFLNYKIQNVRLERNTSLDRVVETFERINRTGEPLSVTDLLVAKLYQSNIKLRELMETASDKYSFWAYVPSEFVLRVICLLRGKEVRRKEILELDASGFEQDWNDACAALERACSRLTDTRAGYGAFDFRRLVPFSTMIVPLAAMLVFLLRNNLETSKNFEKIDRWYWATVFQNRYNEAVNTKSFSDFNRMREWFTDDAKTIDVVKNFSVDLLDFRVESRNAALYRGCMCLVAKHGALDFQTGQPPQLSVQTEDDHLFPKAVYHINEIFNRTLIDKNEKKGAQLPSKYFSALEVIHGRAQLETILSTHLIDSNGLSALLQDNIEAFRSAREAVFKSKITALVNGY